MKKLTLLSLICLLLVSCGSKNELPIETAATDYYVKVVSITDGDTFKGLTDENVEIRFRMQGIDAPENTQAYYSKSKDKLSELIFEKKVLIKTHTEKDAYGRPVVYVYTSEGKDAGAEMLRAGMAWHFKRYDTSELYSKLEYEARKSKVGLWADEYPIAPWDFRKSN